MIAAEPAKARFLTFVACALSILVFFMACSNSRPSHPAETTELVPVKMYVNVAQFTGPGLYVMVPTTFSASAKEPGSFILNVYNLLDDDIFLQDDSVDTVGVNLNYPGGGILAGGSSLTIGEPGFPYRLLHRGTRNPDGSRSARDDGIASFRRVAPLIKSSKAGCSGNMCLIVSGYFQGSRKYFCETFEVPIKVVP